MSLIVGCHTYGYGHSVNNSTPPGVDSSGNVVGGGQSGTLVNATIIGVVVVTGGTAVIASIAAVAGAGSGGTMITVVTAEGNTVTGMRAGLIIAAILELIHELSGCGE